MQSLSRINNDANLQKEVTNLNSEAVAVFQAD